MCLCLRLLTRSDCRIQPLKRLHLFLMHLLAVRRRLVLALVKRGVAELRRQLLSVLVRHVPTVRLDKLGRPEAVVVGEVALGAEDVGVEGALGKGGALEGCL